MHKKWRQSRRLNWHNKTRPPISSRTNQKARPRQTKFVIPSLYDDSKKTRSDHSAHLVGASLVAGVAVVGALRSRRGGGRGGGGAGGRGARGDTHAADDL